jgi:hypothetical protein
MPLTFSALSLGPGNADTTLTGYRTSGSSCVIAAALHVGFAEDLSDSQLIPLLGGVLDRAAAAVPGHSSADLLGRLHSEAERTGRYYSGIAICSHGPARSLAQAGLVSVRAFAGTLRPVTEPDIIAGQSVPILTSALGTRQFRGPEVTSRDPRERLAVFVGGTAADGLSDSLRGLSPAAPDPASRGGIVILVRAATWYEPTTAQTGLGGTEPLRL